MDIWTENVTVTLGDVDRSNRVKPSAFFSYFQHATTLHGDALGIGAGKIAEAGQGWVLSRFSTRIERRPTMSETLTLKTWPRGFKKLFAIRDYLITDNENNVVAKARSGWLVIDINKRRPLREESLHTKLPRNENMPDMIAEGLVSLNGHDSLALMGEIVPSYSYTDYNGHVNNVRYVEWAEDCAGLAPMLAAEKLHIDINYINETMPGTVVEIFKHNRDGFTAVEAKRKEDKQSIFRAEINILS